MGDAALDFATIFSGLRGLTCLGRRARRPGVPPFPDAKNLSES